MTLDLRQLATFLAIVDHGSLGHAAEALHITQPALSRTIKRLASQLGAALFERHSKGMAPSAIGQSLLPHAQLRLPGLNAPPDLGRRAQRLPDQVLPLRDVVGRRRLTAFRRRQGFLPGAAAALVAELGSG